jgi:hypothetical protein
MAQGLVQRAGLGLMHLWFLIVCVGILYATRGPARRSDLIPVRPRDFLARSWSGHGQVVLRPLAIGRFFPQRLDARRTATWLSDRVWRFEDEARFGESRVERRQMYCEFVSDDHVRVTAGDLPDGVDVWLEEGGYRVADFRIAYSIGPLPFLVRCHERSRVESDGTLVNEFDVFTIGIPIPLARVTFRVKPVEEQPSPAGGEARALEPA